MMIPTIHLNGTARVSLEEQIADAAIAITVAIVKLREMSPNGRDYYTQGPQAIGKALEEHEERIKRLRDVHAELEAIFEGIGEQAHPGSRTVRIVHDAITPTLYGDETIPGSARDPNS